jgi:hypothetical protein
MRVKERLSVVVIPVCNGERLVAQFKRDFNSVE